MPQKCVVVLSGGQDSTTALYWAKTKFDEIHAVTFDYGQRHRRELESAEKIAKMAEVKSWELIDLDGVLQGKSPLTDHEQPLEQYESHDEMEKIIGNRVELTFVPMRNALFLTIAANRAITKDAKHLVTGVCQMDNANYPDCRRGFIRAMEQMTEEALGLNGFDFVIETPLMTLTKAESIKLAKTLPGCMEALAYSHTAYDGQYPPLGKDHATVLRAQGFLEAHEPDPLIVRAWREGLMQLPETTNYDSVRAG